MTLDADEFIRRFLLHVLPKGFQRIRQYGFLANRAKRRKLALCRRLLADATEVASRPDDERDDQSPAGPPTASRCPVCNQGRMQIVAVLDPAVSARPRPPPSDPGRADHRRAA